MKTQRAPRGGAYEINMTEGPLLGKIIRFAIPLALSSILQLLFNAADMVVAGRFAGNQALAAVGSTGALIQLIINLFIGLSVGVNVLVARFYGAGQDLDLNETVHTAVLTSIVSGVFLIAAGVALSRPLLSLMGTPADVIDQSVLYMRIYFCGMPVMMLYNFGSAILRAVGDTRRPLYFLLLAGVVNVGLNLFFVIVVGIGVAGVAIATVISQAISAFLVLRCLIKSDGPYRVEVKRLKIYMKKLRAMVQIGVPAGLQSAAFSISNVIIQSTLNTFGSVAMAGSTAAGNIEGFVFGMMDSLSQATLSFTGQNVGAGKFDRVNKVVWECLALVTGVGLFAGVGTCLLGRPLLSIYTGDPEVINWGMQRMLMVCAPYFTCGVMNVLASALRGMGSNFTPMLVTIFGVCGIRILWVALIFPMNPTFMMLYASYPVSWVITFFIELPCFLIVRRRVEFRVKHTPPPVHD